MENPFKRPNLLADDVVGEDNDFIPLLTSEDEENMNSEKTPEILPILPLRNTVLPTQSSPVAVVERR